MAMLNHQRVYIYFFIIYIYIHHDLSPSKLQLWPSGRLPLRRSRQVSRGGRSHEQHQLLACLQPGKTFFKNTSPARQRAEGHRDTAMLRFRFWRPQGFMVHIYHMCVYMYILFAQYLYISPYLNWLDTPSIFVAPCPSWMRWRLRHMNSWGWGNSPECDGDKRWELCQVDHVLIHIPVI